MQEYSRAYEFAPLAAFLFNMGQCHRQLSNHERAVFFYEGYLRDKPDAKNREMVQRLIQQSKLELERQEAERKRQEHLTAEREREEKLRLDNERKLRLEKEHNLAIERARLTAQALANSQKPVEAQPSFYQKWWFWTIVGGALAVIVGGTALAMSVEDTMVLPGGSLGTLDLRGARP